jgi:hypothetical protein
VSGAAAQSIGENNTRRHTPTAGRILRNRLTGEFGLSAVTAGKPGIGHTSVTRERGRSCNVTTQKFFYNDRVENYGFAFHPVLDQEIHRRVLGRRHAPSADVLRTSQRARNADVCEGAALPAKFNLMNPSLDRLVRAAPAVEYRGRGLARNAEKIRAIA